MASSPCTPQAQGRVPTQQQAAVLRPTDAANHPINSLSEQLLSCTISKPTHKREQTSATPASQARPRTQRRTTPDGQENTTTPPADDAADKDDEVTPSRLSCLSELQDELSCAVCLEICVRPCATPCGHAFCRSCLRQALQVKRQCPKCRATLPPPSSWQPKVNTALWNTIQLLFPRHAAQAPPPTPEVQVAAASSRARTAAGTHQPRHRHVADMLATGAATGVFASDAAVRRGFRPPRPVDAVQADWAPRATRGTRQQRQQQMDQFVMPADLGAMLQDMYRTGTGSDGSRIAQNTRSQTVAQPTQASVWHQQQQRGSQRSSPLARAQQQTVVLEPDGDNDSGIDWEQFDFSILDDPPSQQQQAASQNSNHQQRAQRHSRQQTRRAAAARVHAAIADELQSSSAASGGYGDDDEALRAAILASLHDAGAPAAASAAAAGSSRAAAAGSRPLEQQRARRQRQQPSRERSAALFGLVHSGRSPQQQWAVHSDDEDVLLDEDWLLDGSTADPEPRGAATSQGSGSRPQVSSSGAATAADLNPEAVARDNSTQYTAEYNQNPLHRRGTVAGSPNAAVPTAGQVDPAATVAVSNEQRGRLVHQIANAVPRRRCPGRRVIMSGSESFESDGEVSESAGAMHNAAAGQEQTASAGVVASVTSDRELGAAAVQQADYEPGTAIAVSAAVDEPLDVSVLSLAPSPEPQPLAARLARFGSHPQQQQQQPVRPRLHQEATFIASRIQRCDQVVSSADGSNSSSSIISSNPSATAAAALQVASLRSRLSKSSSSSSSRNEISITGPASVSADRINRLSQPTTSSAAPQMDRPAVDDSSDEFQPASQLPGRRLTALRAATTGSVSSASSIRGVPSAGRVVSGLRRGDRGRHRRGDR